MQKIRVGITGQAGFVGTHLFNYLGIFKEQFERIPFEDSYFDNAEKFNDFLSQCDVIVHLAALNRHSDPGEIYSKNIELTEKLITGLEKADKFPHIIFSSSTQEDLDNVYGKSKKKCRALLINWAKQNKSGFTGMVIPNVFGPFGAPFYNSVVSTFSYQITHNEAPKIEIDKNLELIYVNNLLKRITGIILNKIYNDEYRIEYDFESKVTDILKKLNYYYSSYFSNNILPCLENDNDIALFNTLRSYIDYDLLLRNIDKKEDNRGFLTEIIKTNTKGQSFFSSTKPGIVRGNHYHLRKIERFSVIQGNAVIRLRKIGTATVREYKVSGEKPSFIDIPIWHTHNIENTGKGELLTLFWSNEIFNTEDSDVYYEEV